MRNKPEKQQQLQQEKNQSFSSFLFCYLKLIMIIFVRFLFMAGFLRKMKEKTEDDLQERTAPERRLTYLFYAAEHKNLIIINSTCHVCNMRGPKVFLIRFYLSFFFIEFQ